MKTFLQLFAAFFLSITSAIAQDHPDTLRYKTVAAGPEYKRSSFYKWLWGTNRRKEWITPIKVPVMYLDTLRGGVKEFKIGGGHQSKSLHIKTADGKEYALRSADKTLNYFLPDIVKHTFIQHLANDEISMSHPYGAMAVPLMAQAAGLPHTIPQFVWIPKQPALDSLNAVYGDRLYLFEQRPAGNWSDADNLGNFKKFISSEEMMDKIFEDHDRKVDQDAFIKARLFDMIIGDWDRHLDQWKWGTVEDGDEKFYKPVATDRDQAFFYFNGLLLKPAISASGQKYLQPFDYKIKDVTAIERRFLDRLLTNEATLEQWQTQARNLQQLLTDNAIESSVKLLLPEIFAISGNDMIAKIKSRRDHLEEYATQYYYFLAKEVEIVGTRQNEYFEVNRLNDNETAVNLYKINKKGEKKDSAFYHRVFKTGETEEIRLYGLSGEDVYNISGKVNNGIRIRIIGGDKKDSVIDNSNVRTIVYDDRNNTFIKGPKTKLRLSDSTDHTFNYDYYLPDKKGISPLLSYNNEDRLFVGIGYNAVRHKWRRLPFASKQNFGVHYSISQNAFAVFYNVLFPNLFGKWDLNWNATIDAVRWTNFYGLGNETPFTTKDVNFNRMRNIDEVGTLGIQRKFGKSTINISGFVETVKIINDPDRFIAKVFAPVNPGVFNTNTYTGGQLAYKVVLLNDSIVPTKGVAFFGNASYTQNLHGSQSFGNYSGIVQFYIPFISKFSLSVRSGGATTSGDPMFYQMPHIGGADDLRGYKRERFWGRSTFFNSNELRFITNIRTYALNGKIGLTVFYDDGRVWMPSEVSNTWHTDYGFGLLLAPFNKLLANIAYGISNEAKVIQVRLIKSF